MLEAPRTPNTGYVLAFQANPTIQATVSVVTAGTDAPAAVANEIAVIEEPPPNTLSLQVWGESGATVKVRVIGWRRESRTGLWMPATLAQVDVVMHGTGYSDSVNGDTLFPAATHTKNLNTDNVKTLDGNTTVKCAGSFSVDTHGFQKITVGLTTASGTAKANVAFAGY